MGIRTINIFGVMRSPLHIGGFNLPMRQPFELKTRQYDNPNDEALPPSDWKVGNEIVFETAIDFVGRKQPMEWVHSKAAPEAFLHELYAIRNRKLPQKSIFSDKYEKALEACARDAEMLVAGSTLLEEAYVAYEAELEAQRKAMEDEWVNVLAEIGPELANAIHRSLFPVIAGGKTE